MSRRDSRDAATRDTAAKSTAAKTAVAKSRIGLRSRLTLLVTGVFAFALVLSTIVVTRVVEARLVEDSRSSAEALLSDYLDSINGGVAAIGIVDETQSTQFFYLSEDGDEVSPAQYFDTLITASMLEDGMPGIGTQAIVLSDTEALTDSEVVGSLASELLVRATDLSTISGQFDAGSGELISPDGVVLNISIQPTPLGQPTAVDRGDDVVAVSQVLEFADGTTISVGVSRPLQPVTESLDTVRRTLWFAVPALIAAVAMAAWSATTRALRPVGGITDQAQAITAANIGERVPVPEANDEIRALATTVNSMLERLDSSQRQQRQLVADASHELRSPVAASRAQLEVAQANPEGTDWLRTADAVLSEQAYLSNLIDGLVALSRLDEAGAGEHQNVDLSVLVETEAARHPEVIQASTSGPVVVSASTELVTRAIRNLVDNAVRHAESEVTITVAERGGAAVVYVDDDGPGVPFEHREAVFNRFTRLDEARDRDSGGAGLGLAIAQEVALAHNGVLSVADSPLGGARFTLTLPC